MDPLTVALVLAFIASGSSSSSSPGSAGTPIPQRDPKTKLPTGGTRPGAGAGAGTTPGLVWSGFYNGGQDIEQRFAVARNGASWAWRIDGLGSGAESTPIEALKTALGLLGDRWKNTGGPVWLTASRGDSEVAYASVSITLGGLYIWRVEVPSRREPVASGEGATRGAALLGLLSWLDAHGGGVDVTAGNR